MHAKFRFLMQDPRHYQIAVLASLLVYTLIWLDFEIAIQSAAAIVGTALLAQYICTRAGKLGSFDPSSALISGLSLCLLLRTNSLHLAAATAVLFNSASQVVLVRNGDRTVLTMANDFKGDPKEFAVVVPVPTVIAQDQIRVSDRALLEHIDAYSAPRLVEYFDNNPCRPIMLQSEFSANGVRSGAALDAFRDSRARSLGVTIEAQYTVGEYDILILSARESTGLETWLRQNNYRIVRYDNAHFPEDLVFQETADRSNFQGRYVLRHAWNGADTCPAAVQYRQQLPQRSDNEARTLASLTGWSTEDIRRQMGTPWRDSLNRILRWPTPRGQAVDSGFLSTVEADQNIMAA